MKSIKINLKVIAVLLSVILLLQSCGSPSSYIGSYSLMDAYNSKRETRITTVNQEKFKYLKIDTINGKFVGQKLSNNQLVNEPLDTKAITRVELKKTKESRNNEVLAFLLGITLLVSLILTFTIDDYCFQCDE